MKILQKKEDWKMSKDLFTRDTQAIFWNLNVKAIQRMLDYDYLIGREKPSVAAIVAPTRAGSIHKVFFGPKEIIIPIYGSVTEAHQHHPNCEVLINFASFRTAYEVTKEAFEIDGIKTIVITAEGIPERFEREMAHRAKELGKLVIGPSTVGAINPGSFKVANIGGAIENIMESQLFKKGSVGLVTRSGGLFNELANIIFRNSDGLYEGVAIGGDRYPGSLFLEHLLRMEANSNIKMMVILGELGGRAEYEIIEAVKAGKITKPIVGWCIGTVSSAIKSEVQFGHAGAKADKTAETAQTKNAAMKEAGIYVPESFNDLPELISYVAKKTGAEKKEIEVHPELEKRAKVLMSKRRPTNFICTISDDTGAEPTYAGIPMSEVIGQGYSVGEVISLLWFRKRLPKWATDFIELVIKIVADHGPAVSGAHNTRVSARAGKDLVSSLASGLLTIGPRFGGAIDGAAQYFYDAYIRGLAPDEFVVEMKKKGINIPGIGHRIKSVRNPDKRVELLKEYAGKNFPKLSLLPYALEVEKVTTSKKENLILNVDGTIGILFVDLLVSLEYEPDKIKEIISQWGLLNGLFILGRSIGFIGHYIDEKRLNMPLYRHPWDDILYLDKEKDI
jgi:ATP-citrate lyase alpha-subunit